jgi:hypothetical protein
MTDENTTTRIDSLGRELRVEFDGVVALRRQYDAAWVDALRQYKGIYPPEVMARLAAHDTNDGQKSKIFLRMTKVKCDAIQARLMDLLFPANGSTNWDISPTPVPNVREEAVQAGLAAFALSGGNPDELDEEVFRRDIAQETCRAMARTMRDQLAETPKRQSYRKTCDSMIAHAVRYGTGVLKGPLVEKRTRMGYASKDGKWALQQIDDGLWPFFEFVPIWSIFPDMAATNKQELRFVWQEHVMTDKDLQDLVRFPKFKPEVILKYMAEHPEGDAERRDYELAVRQLSDDVTAPDLKGRFRVLERWGFLSGRQLAEAGVDVPEDQLSHVFSSNVWLLGSRVVKAVINPLQGCDFPFYFYHFSKDESSFFGEGAPKLMDDCQAGINASVRMLVDNAALSSGPIIGLNQRALSEGQDGTKLYPWKIFLFDEVADMDQLMKTWNLQSNSKDLITILELFQAFADELTTPRYMYGDQNVGGAGKTASGLSMLMGAANIAIKSLVKAFDDDVTIPFISALYHWNMQWSKDVAIKGDYNVVAMGSTNLVAKELRAQQHQILLGVTSAPRFEGMTDDKKWLAHVMRDSEMPEDIVRSDEQYRAWKQEQLNMQAKAQADALLQSLIEQAEKAGIGPQDAFMHVLKSVSPLLAQGGAVSPAMAPGGVQ